MVDGDLRLDLEERVLFVGGGHHLETMGGLKPSEMRFRTLFCYAATVGVQG